jgi:hypothetical protein
VKRIIDGATYNTDTSTLLARSNYVALYNNEEAECHGALYQTRGGAFFVHEKLDLGSDDDGVQIIRDRAKALNAKDAETWIMTGDVEIIHNPFGEPPEAEAENAPAATLYVRVPSVLKRQVEEASKDANLSVNTFMLRCAENCLKNDRAPKPLAKIWAISSGFREGGEWKRETILEAISEIADETENLVKEMFPDSEIEGVMPSWDEYYLEDIREKYNPYPEE